MKILFLNSFDRVGGAAKGCYNLFRGLKEIGVNVDFLAQVKVFDDDDILGPENIIEKYINYRREAFDRLPVMFYKKKPSACYYPAITPNKTLLKRIKKINPDVLHLHWVARGMLDLNMLKQLDCKIVWTLRDMWAFTGGCHYTEECLKYQSTCGACPILNSKKERDLAYNTFKRKQEAWKDVSMTITPISEWLSDCARKSTLLKNQDIQTINNCIPVKTFKAFDKIESRQSLSLSIDKKIVLFGALQSLQDRRKGFKYLLEALNILKQKNTLTQNVELVIFGADEPKDPVDLGFKTHYMGYVSDSEKLSKIYSSADVMVVPSTQEAFGKTAAESMSCKTPVVAFADTGLTDIISHKQDGYLAELYNSQDLSKGIEWVIEDLQRHQELSEKALQKVQTKFDIITVAKQYKTLYEKLLER